MNAAHDLRIINRGGRVLTEYETLVDQLADTEPHFGFLHADQLRPLTDAEVKLVYEARPVDVNDAFVKDFDLDDFMDVTPIILGARFSFRREQAARKVIYYDVICECERREQFASWNQR